MATDKEAVYDEQIFPLMAQIVGICKKHGIAFVFEAAIGEGEHDDNELKGASHLLNDACELEGAEMARSRRFIVSAFTIKKGGRRDDTATTEWRTATHQAASRRTRRRDA